MKTTITTQQASGQTQVHYRDAEYYAKHPQCDPANKVAAHTPGPSPASIARAAIAKATGT